MNREKSISLMLVDTLDRIGVSKQMRLKYQQYGKTCEILQTIDKGFQVKVYRFGSTCEGTTTPGLQSDVDTLACIMIPVILSLEDAPEKGFAALLTLSNETQHGYVKLQVVNNRSVVTGNVWKQQILDISADIQLHSSGIYYWTSHPEFRSSADVVLMNLPARGPAKTYYAARGMNRDYVTSMRCINWPNFAHEWVSRTRFYDWPSKENISHFQSLGFFVVPVGHPYSQEKDLEWRVSFSLQERHLMFQLTDVQHKCYVMLKLINNDLIKGVLGKSITSYHLKTCLFYAIEQNPPSLWVPENLFSCVLECLNILLEWTKKDYCPNYFIPKENMFHGKLSADTRLKLIDVLHNLIKDDAIFLKRIETDNLGFIFQNKISSIDDLNAIEEQSYHAKSSAMYDYVVETINLTMLNIMSMFNLIYTSDEKHKNDEKADIYFIFDCKHFRTIVRHYQLIWCLSHFSMKLIMNHTVVDFRDAIELLLSFLHTSLASHLAAYALRFGGVLFQKFLLQGFDTGMLSDLTSGRLKYITYLYACGQYHLCEHELISLERAFRPYVIQVSPFRNLPKKNYSMLRMKLANEDYLLTDIFKLLVSATVVFLPTEMELIPHALQFEMFRSAGTLPKSRLCTDFWYDWVVVDSKVYMYFLWYLLSRKMKFSTEKRLSFIDKMALASDDSVEHSETSGNLLAWVFAQENFVPFAIECLYISWGDLRRYILHNHRGIEKQYFEHHNAAKWHMLVLLWRIWVSKNKVLTISFCFKCLKQTFTESCRCKIAKYCSKYCQEMDWNSHKKICQLFK